MSDFLGYMLAQAEKREAYQQYNHASSKLQLAQIKERFAEIISQHNPINERFPELQEAERERLIDLVRYVVIGRFETPLNEVIR
jgi:hypothetical protein